MKNSILLLLALFAFQTICSAQNFEWAKSMGGLRSDYGKQLTVDDSGNVYSIGSFYETCDFDGVEFTSKGQEDIFIQKLDSEGNRLWVKSIGGQYLDTGESIATDKNGNVYVVGFFRGTTDFDPNAGVQEVSAEGTDSFILKLDGAGNFIWVKTLGNGSFVHVRDIEVDHAGDLIIAGSFKETVDFDLGAGVFELSSEEGYDAYLLKLDPAGEFVWAKSMSGATYTIALSLAVDASNNIYTVGHFNGTVDFDPTDGVMELTTVDDSYLFIQKLDQEGNFTWAKAINPNAPTFRLSVEVDLAGNVFMGGYFADTVDFDPGVGVEVEEVSSNGLLDGFIQKLDTDGDFVWVKVIQGFGICGVRRLAIDDLGNVYSTGFFEGTFDFDPSEEEMKFSSQGHTHLFVQKLDNDGNLDWVKILGNPGAVASGQGIAVGTTRELYVTGKFFEQVDFDPGEEEFEIKSTDMDDAFILKLSTISVATKNLALPAASIFPNPNNGHFQIALPENTPSAQVRILNAFGQNVYQSQLNDSVNQLDLDHLGTGLYFLNMTLPNEAVYHGKLLIQK